MARIDSFREPVNYQDLFAYYLVEPGDLLVTNDQAIEESIRNILTVGIGSLMFDRSFGSDLLKMLFEEVNDETAGKIFMYTIANLEANEPRVLVIPGASQVIPFATQNMYGILLTYQIRDTKAINRYNFRLKAAK